MVKGLSLQILAEIAGTWLDDRKLLYNVFLNQVTQKHVWIPFFCHRSFNWRIELLEYEGHKPKFLKLGGSFHKS